MSVRERIKRFTDHLPDQDLPEEPEEPDEIEAEELEDDEPQEIETKTITVDVDAAAQRIDDMFADGWQLDDHIVAPPQVILIFSREKE